MNIHQVVEIILCRICKSSVHTSPSIIDEEVKSIGLPFILERLLNLYREIIEGFRIGSI
jgi:hypothetical protein